MSHPRSSWIAVSLRTRQPSIVGARGFRLPFRATPHRGPADLNASRAARRPGQKEFQASHGHTFICPPWVSSATPLALPPVPVRAGGNDLSDAILVIGGSGLLGARGATAALAENRTFARYLDHRFALPGGEGLSLDVPDYHQAHA